MDLLAAERQDIINTLADVRKKIYAIINQECSCIVLNGEDISPSKAATFVVEHADELSYIPGNVRLYAPLPLSFEQLTTLYRSNDLVTAADESELDNELPNPKDLIIPSDFSTACDQYQRTLNQIGNIEAKNSWDIKFDNVERLISFSGGFGSFSMPYPDSADIEALKRFALSFGKIEDWMKAVAVDGKTDSSYRQRWQLLMDEIIKACKCADEYVALSLGKQLVINEEIPLGLVKTAFEEMRPIFANNGKISKFTLLFHKEYTQALGAVTINGNSPTSAEDCAFVLKYIELQEARQNCRAVWDALLVPYKVPAFDMLDKDSPERIAANWVPLIKKYLNWYNTAYHPLLNKLSAVEIPLAVLFQKNILDSEMVATDKILTCVEMIIPEICDACISVIKSYDCLSELRKQNDILTFGKHVNSRICRSLADAINKCNSRAYAHAYADLEEMYDKYELQRSRNEALKILEPVAPQWADAIRTREGVHDACIVPSNIDDAWKWKQLYGIIEEITQKPFAELQSESLRLSREYREVTAKYAEKSGWYHLLRRTEADISMKQALEGWRLTVKSIGKGTGKRAPMLKAKARELMVQCQKAVPCWIMPINKALESLDPRANKFDVIIIDEASQSDVSSLAILYMGKKLVIVGDDKQVSPMAVGVEDRKITSLQEQYIKDKIPNAHLYTAKTSIYDIAKTTFQPLMLREHFRCVPEIIGFSNMLSYDGKIKPLRDASNSTLLPAVVNYRVAGGKRDAKTNLGEAQTIIALMQACFEQPEYAGKSFGVISMLGDEQVKLIQQQIELKLKPQDIIGRNILCGNSANFQGDERDVIFLSLVDSGAENGPLHMLNFGPDDSYRKRYNVAVSRAKDQLWVVDSLDPANDLKPGDIRKMLIDYSLNPSAQEIAHNEIRERADSPFEVSVATALSDRGYHLVQQWKVGSYRLDIVAVCGKKKVAIECDGERWHSGEEKIREDMERQTILERLGWRFIRIRGSEFYRNSEKTIERIISELSGYGIEPETVSKAESVGRETELLNRVKSRAHAILNSESKGNDEPDIETIAAALDPGKLVTDFAPSKGPEDALVSLQKVACVENAKGKVKSDVFESEATTKSSKVEELILAGSHRSTVAKQNTSKSEPKKSAEQATPKQKISGKSPEEFSEQQAIPGVRKYGKKNNQKSKSNVFIEELIQHDVKIVDNREKSGIVWIIYDNGKKVFIEETIKKYNLTAYLERRGAVATNNCPAWRVMI